MATHMEVKGFAEHQPTPRELQVLELICEGHSTKRIAALLGLSYKTVCHYRTGLLAKAGVHDSIRLFRWALAKGHVRLGEALPPAGPTTA